MMRNLRQTETTVEKSPVDFMFDTMETISYYKVLVNFSKIKKKQWQAETASKSSRASVWFPMPLALNRSA